MCLKYYQMLKHSIVVGNTHRKVLTTLKSSRWTNITVLWSHVASVAKKSVRIHKHVYPL